MGVLFKNGSEFLTIQADLILLGPYSTPLVNIDLSRNDIIYRYLVLEIMLGKILAFGILSFIITLTLLFRNKFSFIGQHQKQDLENRGSPDPVSEILDDTLNSNASSIFLEE